MPPGSCMNQQYRQVQVHIPPPPGRLYTLLTNHPAADYSPLCGAHESLLQPCSCTHLPAVLPCAYIPLAAPLATTPLPIYPFSTSPSYASQTSLCMVALRCGSTLLGNLWMGLGGLETPSGPYPYQLQIQNQNERRGTLKFPWRTDWIQHM
ncbi:hypothetical protein EV702DRAFT_1094785 [Suillus placidus]|uniref:Uncharacterized protein n=1 Tax=Suillus placidus TaxID=48579 RepID=A0A9P6ZWR2_9AGAM|nr:hypothetical protein EV702DRAFT_1094785 [Suillus placidus]